LKDVSGMNSTQGLHAPCQAATAKVLRHAPFYAKPATLCDSYQSAENNRPLNRRNQNRASLPTACAVETDADRPFFMHILGEIYTLRNLS
jgi:hypothetical protein